MLHDLRELLDSYLPPSKLLFGSRFEKYQILMVCSSSELGVSQETIKLLEEIINGVSLLLRTSIPTELYFG